MLDTDLADNLARVSTWADRRQVPRDAVVMTVDRAKILWLLRLNADPVSGLQMCDYAGNGYVLSH
jgi:hypothetical protein